MNTKTCTKCGKEKPATEENFYPHQLEDANGTRLHQVPSLVASGVQTVDLGHAGRHVEADSREFDQVLEYEQFLQDRNYGAIYGGSEEGTIECPGEDGRGLKEVSTLKLLNSVEVSFGDNTEPDRVVCDNGVTTMLHEVTRAATAANQHSLVEDIV